MPLMNPTPRFILTPGIWLGEGKITLSTSPEELRFYTKWEIEQATPTSLKALQLVEIEGVKGQLINRFYIDEITADAFVIWLENEHIPLIQGAGSLTPTFLSWNFLAEDRLVGKESYQQQPNGDYLLTAEYVSASHRTTISGHLWKKL